MFRGCKAAGLRSAGTAMILASAASHAATPKFGDVCRVAEFYVCAPQTSRAAAVFAKYSTGAVNFPPLAGFDCNFSKKYPDSGAYCLCGLDEIGFISSDPALGVGFFYWSPVAEVGRTYLACRADMPTVSRDGNMV